MAPESEGWLSITPEPEGELPAAIATLRAGRSPDRASVEAERRRAERLITRARRRAYQRWLADTRAMAAAPRSQDPDVQRAAEVAMDVLDNHDALALGLESRGRGGRGGRGR